MIRTATLSDDRLYRYTLGRRWDLDDDDVRTVLWVMLNPSTADADVDDATIRRCIGFTRSWGYNALEVVNLWALRSTKPANLWTADDPSGPDNERVIVEAIRRSGLVVCAWGSWPDNQPKRRRIEPPDIEDLYRQAHRDTPIHRRSSHLWCVGETTASGAPRHPLYLPADAELDVWRSPLLPVEAP